MRSLWQKIRLILDMIKFEHTIFALPFALISAILAAGNEWPKGRTLGWILLAMVGEGHRPPAASRRSARRNSSRRPFRAVTYTHATGRSISRTRRHLTHARMNASCAASSAASTSPTATASARRTDG